jgi:flagellar protein FliO/FliZ
MIVKIVCIFLLVACYTFSLLAAAESDVLIDKTAHTAEQAKTEINSSAAQDIEEQTAPKLNESNQPEVGKHVMANMDAGSMILSLLMVLVLIVISAFVLKRFNLTQHDGSQLKVLASLSLGTKERVVVIQAGKQQLLLGVTAQKITLLDHLAEPLIAKNLDTTELPKNILSFLTTRRT